jgi:nucleoid-associated protein YgaU
MSTVSIAPATRLRITARGRRLLAALAATPLVIAIGVGVFNGGAALASREDAAVSFDTVTVHSGDTLWAIAQDIAPDVDPREVVDDIARLNQLSSGLIETGQRLAIPTQYSSAG